MSERRLEAGMWLEMGIEAIEEGEFIQALNEEFRAGLRGYLDRCERTNDRSGKMKMAVNFEVCYDPDTDRTIIVKTKMKVAQPERVSASHAIAAEGKVLVQPSGASERDDVEQLRIVYNSKGKIEGEYDPRTGTVADPPDAHKLKTSSG